ncbi:MAG TPA: hypothetical protein DC047_01190 [Blastocatellia bacterium]|nr:hypothetical protein [Blastocatellia bacterium]
MNLGKGLYSIASKLERDLRTTSRTLNLEFRPGDKTSTRSGQIRSPQRPCQAFGVKLQSKTNKQFLTERSFRL